MAARTSIVDESADDGVPADFWNDVLETFDNFEENSEDAAKAAEERARKKKEQDEEKVRKFNEAWKIPPVAEEEVVTRVVIEKPADPVPIPVAKVEPEPIVRSRSPDDCTIIQEEPEIITIDEDTIQVSENSVVVIPAEGQVKDPRLKRLESIRVQSPSSPTQESRMGTSIVREEPPGRYFQIEREQQHRKEQLELARSRLRSRTSVAVSVSDDDSREKVSPRSEAPGRSRHRSRSREDGRSRSKYRSRSRSPRRKRRSRSRSRSRSYERSRRRRSHDRSRSRSPSSRRGGGRSSPTSMMNQMQAMLTMMTDPKVNPMMAMMMQMNPMMAAMATNSAAAQTAPVPPSAPAPAKPPLPPPVVEINDVQMVEQPDKKDELTATLFLESKINLSDFLSSARSNKNPQRVNSRVVQRIKEAISILDKQETKVQSARFLYVAPTYHTDLKKLDNRSPLIWNDQNVLYASTSKSKDVALCEPFRNVNHKMKQMIERLGLDEGNISRLIAEKRREEPTDRSGADVGTIQAITIVPVRGGAATKRLIDRSIQTDESNCLDCVQRRNKTYISVNTQTMSRARTVEISVQTDRDRDVELHSMNDLNANQVKILNEIMKYMKKRQVSGNMNNLLHSLERDCPQLRNEHLNAGLHYVSEINERNERNANRYAGPNPHQPTGGRTMGGAGGSRDPRVNAFNEGHRGVNFDEINAMTSLTPAGFPHTMRSQVPTRAKNNVNSRRPW